MRVLILPSYIALRLRLARQPQDIIPVQVQVQRRWPRYVYFCHDIRRV